MEVLGDSQVVADRERQIAELRLLLETVQTDDRDATVAKAQLETSYLEAAGNAIIYSDL